MRLFLLAAVLWLFTATATAQRTFTILSPNKKLTVTFKLSQKGQPVYSVNRNRELVIKDSRLGLIREDEDFSDSLSFISAAAAPVYDKYELLTIKRRLNNYKANQSVFHLMNADKKLLDIVFLVSNDGLGFQYAFPEVSAEVKKIKEERTSFNIGTGAKAWLQPMSDAKTGWAKVNPAYEEYYEKGIATGTPSPIKAGWVYPALFQTGNNWVAITETFPQGGYCATRLKAESPEGEYSIGFPQEAESKPGDILYPASVLPWRSPWRVIAIGSLKTVTESTLGTDLAAPSVKKDFKGLKPGIASWSWILMGDNSVKYETQKEFIDYAADMHWQYCLVDGLWDKQIGYDKMKELAAYANTKGIGILVWYNSAGDWNETYQTPKNKMLTHESRVQEFGILKEMGIKGIKVDFFGGDGQSVMKYYRDILQDALDAGILVNCHGSTLPRGLQRTYPNLVSMEAIKGFEFATFDQKNMDEQPAHCTTIPFTRNLFDPMDYTPMALYKVDKRERRTTSGFELALPVIFQSGIQHLAETPEGMSHVPDHVKIFLRQLPPYWDDTRFIDGYPGKLTVLARRHGNKWIVAGINGENIEKNVKLDLGFLQAYGAGRFITDGAQPLSFMEGALAASATTSIDMKPYGGFVLVFDK